MCIRDRHSTIRTAAISTAATAGTQLNTMAAIISSMMPAASGALCVRVTLDAVSYTHLDVYKRQSLSSFYYRRIRRIMPAYFCLIAVVLAFGCVVLACDDRRTLGRTVRSSALFITNIYFSRTAGRCV